MGVARRALPTDVLPAVGLHLEAAHGIAEPRRDEIGGWTSRRDAVMVIWKPGGAEGPIFRCRRCPEGLDRYLVDVYATVPTERALPRIREHFRETHRIRELPLGDIAYEGNTGPGKKATWLSATPDHGSGIVCHLCPDGQNRLFLTHAPHGDARRIHRLLEIHPELWNETRGLSTKQQAEYIEARDRGLLQRRGHRDASEALNSAATPRSDAEPLNGALRRILSARVQAGEKITHVIESLAELAAESPVDFSYAVGRELPGLAELAQHTPPELYAEVIARFLLLPEGSYPSVSKRRLWTLWVEQKTRSHNVVTAGRAPAAVDIAHS